MKIEKLGTWLANMLVGIPQMQDKAFEVVEKKTPSQKSFHEVLAFALGVLARSK